MFPDYEKMLYEFVKPVAVFTVFAIAALGWAMAFQKFNEIKTLRKKLGDEAVDNILKENGKDQ